MLLRRINDKKLPPCKAFYAEQTTDSSIAIFVIDCADSRGVAQSGSVLRSGRRGRRFKSSHLDHLLGLQLR